MSDASLMLNMMAGKPKAPILFRDSQIRDLPDVPNNYSNGQATFELRNI